MVRNPLSVFSEVEMLRAVEQRTSWEERLIEQCRAIADGTRGTLTDALISDLGTALVEIAKSPKAALWRHRFDPRHHQSSPARIDDGASYNRIISSLYSVFASSMQFAC